MDASGHFVGHAFVYGHPEGPQDVVIDHVVEEFALSSEVVEIEITSLIEERIVELEAFDQSFISTDIVEVI